MSRLGEGLGEEEFVWLGLASLSRDKCSNWEFPGRGGRLFEDLLELSLAP